MTDPTPASPARDRPLPAYALGLGLALLIAAPLLAAGFVLSYDLVAVPDQPLTARALGLTPELPRAVPIDAVVAVVDEVLAGQVLQRVVLIGLLLGGACGAARVAFDLARAAGWPSASVASGVAATVYVWNPYVAERLVLGHWWLLVAYAVLPWVLRVAWGARAGGPNLWRAMPQLVVLLALAALTPTGGVLAAIVAVCAIGFRRASLVVLVAALVVNAPWLVPGALHPGGSASDPTGVGAFLPRAESWSGLLGTVLGLGGVWNAQAVPASRAGVAAPAASLAILAVALVGVPLLARTVGRSRAMGLLAQVLVGLGLVLLPATPVGADIWETLVVQVPGGGLLRDAHKWAALLAVPLAIAAAAGTATLAGAVARRVAARDRRMVQGGVGALVVVVALLTVPDLAWGVGGRLRPSQYPSDWARVAAVLDASPRDDVLVVLPYQAFRAFPWTGGRTVLDPAPRWFQQDVVVADDLPVGDRVVRGESPRSAAVGAAVASADPASALAALGVTWLLIERHTPGEVPVELARAGEEVVRGSDLVLRRLTPVAAPTEAPRPPAGPVVVADVLAAAIVVLAGLGWAAQAGGVVIGRKGTRLLGSPPSQLRAVDKE